MIAPVLVQWLMRRLFSVNFLNVLAMFIPDKLKVNKFIDVAIPSNRSYFSRIGEVQISSSQFSGDQTAVMNQDKISQIDDYMRYAESKAKEYNKDEKS